MAKKGVGARGRTWAAFIFLGFVLVAASVIQRRVVGRDQALKIRLMEEDLQAAQSRKLKLESEIEAARSLGRIGPIAEEKLGMRAPEKTQIVTIPRKSR